MAVEIIKLSDGTATLTATGAAEHAGVERPTVYSWIRRYKIPVVGKHDNGQNLYRLADIARAEKSTRAGARRNVGLRTVATHEIADHEAVLVRLDCQHLKILSDRHGPTPDRAVACFECSEQRRIAYVVTGQTARAA
ncbi:helix-turn-helix domain-containing protein [Streptomyces pacificus]|uniref:MerR family transcriptional regulator n=1 Tax=Streptomyces pacificus TaxID=2705029 RepID=A0A6A0AMW6_9ACTN|nr:helix-turn-helix domain-containing protein [Streptomyces pacificus]GFH34309.1 MerR family transcriptional regulator [Streptomyces pacificus]